MKGDEGNGGCAMAVGGMDARGEEEGGFLPRLK